MNLIFEFGKNSLIETLRYSDFPEIKSTHTKPYQHAWVNRNLPALITNESSICEVGANNNFSNLKYLKACIKCVIDPYDGRVGGGGVTVPPLPEDVDVIRAAIGVNSDAVPNAHFDLMFSTSVLEHVGQREASFDCDVVDSPPAEQELLRDAFCRESYRITRCGGYGVHLIDHGARNLSWLRNFVNSGFELIHAMVPPAFLNTLLFDDDVVRQVTQWGDASKRISNPHLHCVVVIGVRKPIGGSR